LGVLLAGRSLTEGKEFFEKVFSKVKPCKQRTIALDSKLKMLGSYSETRKTCKYRMASPGSLILRETVEGSSEAQL
jgi:hypothetical protein